LSVKPAVETVKQANYAKWKGVKEIRQFTRLVIRPSAPTLSAFAWFAHSAIPFAFSRLRRSSRLLSHSGRVLEETAKFAKHARIFIKQVVGRSDLILSARKRHQAAFKCRFGRKYQPGRRWGPYKGCQEAVVLESNRAFCRWLDPVDCSSVIPCALRVLWLPFNCHY
jgi:hypothetical protein